jgi:hypothetical protein
MSQEIQKQISQMKFQKIEGFKKMTAEAMAKVTGGDGNTDSTSVKKPLILTDTTHISTATSCMISDGKGGKMNTFDGMD